MPSKRSVKTESHHHRHEVELISAVTDAEYYEVREEKILQMMHFNEQEMSEEMKKEAEKA